MTLNFDFAWEDGSPKNGDRNDVCDEVMTPRTVSLSEGFEVADTVDGHAAPVVPKANEVVKKAVKDLGVVDFESFSDSEREMDMDGEKRMLVEKI